MPSLNSMLRQTLKEHVDSQTAIEAVVSMALRKKLPDADEEDIRTAAKRLISKNSETVAIGDANATNADTPIVTITADELKEATETYTEIVSRTASDATMRALEELVLRLVETMRADGPRVACEIREDVQEFGDLLLKVWGNALDSLDLMINASREANEHYIKNVQEYEEEERNDSVGDQDDDSIESYHYRSYALEKLHARSCRTAMEITVLLRAGLADGAMARWRALHELSVVALFLSEHDEDQARIYLEHEVVSREKRLNSFQHHHHTLGEEPIDDDAANAIRRNASEFLERYGKGYRKDYGWARYSLNAKPKEQIRFVDLEECLNLSHLRPYYQLACESVHAGSAGCFTSIGGGFKEGEVYSGQTMIGLCDTGINCAESLLLVTAAMLTLVPILDHLAMTRALMQVRDDVIGAFLRADQNLKSQMVEE